MASYPLRVLLILIEPPLPFGNAASRWFHVLYHELLARGHNVHVLVASGIEKDILKTKEVFKDPKYKIKTYPFGKSNGTTDKIKNFLFPHKMKFSPDFNQAMDKLKPESFDIIHVEQTWAGWTSLNWAHKALINVHHLQSIDLEFVKPPSFKQKLLFNRWFSTEKYLLSRYKYIRTCSPRLEPLIRKWNPQSLIKTIPVGMDPSLYPFIESSQRQSEKPILTLIGNMGWYPSVSSAKRLLNNLWPEIKKQVPNAQCRIVGWSARSALKDFLHLNDVEILENVPEIQPYFNEASLMLYAPSRGSGMKIKVLEAMLFGVPVVTTSEGAEGLPVEDMVHCGLSDNDSELIQKAVKLLKSPELQESIRLKARSLVTDHCGPQKTVDSIEEFYKEILSKH